MPTLYARIATERASRYLVQFCKHAAAMGAGGHTARMHLHASLTRGQLRVSADWSETAGTVTFTPWGRCTLGATADTLTLAIDAADEDGLTQIRDVVDRDLERFSRRDPVTVTWQRSEISAAAPAERVAAGGPAPRPRSHRARFQAILLALGVILVIGLHVGLAGAVAAHSRWTAIAADLMVALVVLKIAAIAWARFATRRRAATETPAASPRDPR